MLEIGFVKIDRKITQWRWYHDSNTFRVFFHLILTSNYEDKDFETITIKRGERVISYPKLSAELGLSERNVRTAIKHLKETGEVTVRSHSKFSVVTINNYNQYQSSDRQLTDNRQASDNNERKIKKDKESNKDKEEDLLGKPAPSPPSHKPKRHKFGEYGHVRLTDEEYQRLCDEYGKKTADLYIGKCDEYCEIKPKSYGNYNLAIRQWLNRDNVKKRSEEDECFYRSTDPNDAPF